MMRAWLAAALVMLLTPMAWAASTWSVDPAGSEVVFRYTLDGDAKDGKFTVFEATGQFSADRPEDAELSLKVATRSIDLYNTLASAYATSAEWFDSKNHPNVEFTLSKLTSRGGSKYLAEGVLSIRGKQQPTTLELTLEVKDGIARARGSLTITRRDYLLGFGPSMAVVDIGPDVIVDFDLSAQAN